METTSPEGKPKVPRWAVTAMVVLVGTAIIVTSVALYRLFFETPYSAFALDDPENDVVLSTGTEYPGIIDVTRATLKVNGTALDITINVTDTTSYLPEGESAQYNVTLFLQNANFAAYEAWAELNATHLSCSFGELGASNATQCQVDRYRNSLTMHMHINELPEAEEVQWSILTTFEKTSGNELVTSASDIAPDEGLQTTILQK